MTLSVDTSGTAPRPDPQSLAAWAGDQRIFISSVMSATMAPLRTAVVRLVDTLGAEPVWFEGFGGRDDDAEVAYLSEVDSSSIYLGLLGRTYGRLDKATRMSATHAEYRRAEERGLAVSVWVSGEDDVVADEKAFIDEVRTFHTTGTFTDTDDLVEGIRRRLTQMAAGTLSPWVKLGDTVFRAVQARRPPRGRAGSRRSGTQYRSAQRAGLRLPGSPPSSTPHQRGPAWEPGRCCGGPAPSSG